MQQLPLLFAQLRHTMSLVLRAAAACSVLGRRMHARYLQQPLLLGITPSRRSLECTFQQLWCSDEEQRLRLLVLSCPLSTLAFRLARAVVRHEGLRRFEHRAIARIIRRCFSIVASQLFERPRCISKRFQFSRRVTPAPSS